MFFKKKKTVFFLKFSEPLPISIDPFCFSIDWKFLNLIERDSVCFDQSNSFQIVLIESLSVSIDQDCSQSIETRKTCFLKRSSCLFQRDFFKKFFNFSSLSDSAKAPPKIFCCFSSEFLQGFFLSKLVSPFCPSFCILFHVFMHFSCTELGIFGTFNIVGFLRIQTFSGEIDQWVFVLGCYIDDSCRLIWSILWFLKNLKFYGLKLIRFGDFIKIGLNWGIWSLFF